MTNAIEQAKREMYEALAILKGRIEINYSIKDMMRGAEEFEGLFESYLEQVRQDHEALHETARKRFLDIQSLEAGNEKLSKALRYTNETIQNCAAQSLETIRDLESRLAAMKNERDSIQLRLHAVDHAYSESQKTVGNQMDVIASLQGRQADLIRKQRKAGTCGQVCGDRGAIEQLGGKAAGVLAKAVFECQGIVTNWAMNGLRAKKAIRAVSAIVNGNAKVLQAMADLESAEVKK